MTTARAAGTERSIRPATYAFFAAVFGLAVFATHAGMLRLPFYWDELGQFVPAALDIYRDGAWVPHSAVPNVHPPGVMAYLAAVWHAFGFSVEATRAAMLTLASLALFFAFLLAIELGRNAPGAPAFAAALFLCASPVFVAQAVLAQLDMPAMLFTTIALLCFLQERLAAAALAATALVMVKETGLIVPAVFALWLVRERRFRQAALFALPAIPLAAWIVVLKSGTGQIFGDAGFAHYNLIYPLHPVRLAVAILRRLHYLFTADFHWVGTIALIYAWRRTDLFRTRAWKIAWLVVAAHAAAFSVAGGAVLERYLLPALPALYAAMASAMMFYGRPWRLASVAALALGLAAGNLWDPPHPFPPENNLAWTDAVRLHREAAQYAERHYGGARIATAWPLAPALARPDFGYVGRPLEVEPLPDLLPETVNGIDWRRTQVLILFSRTHDPAWNLFRWAPVRAMWMRYWGYRPDIAPREVQAHLPVKLTARWSRRGQWVEVYESEGAADRPR